MVSLRNSYANSYDIITLFSIQMQMSMHLFILTAIIIMIDYVKICYDNECGEDNLVCMLICIWIDNSVISFAFAYAIRKLNNHQLRT